MKDITRSPVNFISEKLKKPEIPNLNATTAAKKEYVSAINHWEDRNDRDC